MEQRRLATDKEMAAALHALEVRPIRVAADTWPGGLENLDWPGLYSWWVDDRGGHDLSTGLGHPVTSGRIYAGQSGATRWPSGTTTAMTLGSRISGHHLRGRIRSSTFRLTLAAALQKVLRLRATGPTLLGTHSENLLSNWIRSHLEVAVHPFEDRGALKDLEHRVLLVLDPPLNLEGMATTPLRSALSGLRFDLAGRSQERATKRRESKRVVRDREAKLAAPALSEVNTWIQHELQRRELVEVSAVEAARWLNSAALVVDSDHGPGLPLRNLLRAGLILGAEQRPPKPNGRWIITRIRG